MPELPEVETVKRTLSALIINKQIEDVVITLPRIIQRPDDVEEFRSELQGQTFESVERRGKFLRFILSDSVMVSHLRMEGRYGVFEKGEPVDKHTHVRFVFTDGSELRYTDVRQFGTMHIFEKGTEFEHLPLSQLGPEPLEESFTVEVLRSKLGSTRAIKTLLLDQTKLVGLGNIYVDEALFLAGIHPAVPAHDLTQENTEALYKAIKTTLQGAVDAGGSSVKSYVNGQGEMGMFQQQLRVYGRKNEACRECEDVIERFVLGGRGTHICPSCQPMQKQVRV
ncbi:DNA-formamidopyrimidine glycosylase [Alkalicoccus daliensis]|uniref:Formamidopyrimidine-DNA glycosylase n=1 Tax=Alkalicoccus daliensis TaxID=745820 RepID=A0A1H0CDQ6_9BACI|nr:DNA-formamidopyrimidine glycosylase [Alkalicoccus daliensis]SDN56015.1 DNA-(apurinic or apyrimidinic site) lyase [Alkalicoccus daliensis]